MSSPVKHGERPISFLEKNFAILKMKAPAVLDWLVQSKDDPRMEWITSPGGLANLRFPVPGGGHVDLYLADPIQEERERIQGMQFGSGQVTFLVGAGLGYILDLIQEKAQAGHRLVLFESNPTLLKKVLSRMDLSDLLEKGSLVISPPDPQSVKETILQNVQVGRSINMSLIVGDPRLLATQKEFLELNNRVLKNCEEQYHVICTTEHHSRTFVQNEIANLPKYLLSPGIKNLFDRFGHVPAFVVSAGPSLERNIQHLRQAQGKAVIVATMPVVRVLLAYDIRPDFMVSIDFKEGNRVHFEGLWDLQDVPLIFPLRLASGIVQDFQGEMIALQDESIWLSSHFENKGAVPTSGSVAGRALKVAISLGCEPIILVGQDLSFGEKTHVEGSARSRGLRPGEEKENFLWAEGTYGERVLTSLRFLGFLSDLEETLRQCPRKLINATAKGIRIKGTEEMPLPECIRRYCTQEVDIRSVLKESLQIGNIDFEGILRELDSTRKAMERIKERAAREITSFRAVEKLRAMGKLDHSKVIQWMKESDEFVIQFNDFVRSFGLFSFYLYSEITALNQGSYEVQETHTPEKIFHIYWKRNEVLNTSVSQAVEALSVSIDHLRGVLANVQRILDEKERNPDSPEVHLELGNLWSEIGFHRRSVPEYREALALGADPRQVHGPLGKSLRLLGKFKEAREQFQALEKQGAIPVFPQGELAAIEEELRRSEEKAESYFQDGNWVNALLYARRASREEETWEAGKRIERWAIKLRDRKIAEMDAASEKENLERKRKSKYRELTNRGKDLFNRGAFREAMEVLEEARLLSEDPVEVQSLMACCHSEMGDLARAEELLTGLIERHPRNGLFHANLGRTYMRHRLFGRAALEFEEAAACEPKLANLLLDAGAIYMDVKEYGRAIICFEKGLESFPKKADLLHKIASCYLAKGETERAEASFREALVIQPTLIPAQMGLQAIQKNRSPRTPGDRGPAVGAKE